MTQLFIFGLGYTAKHIAQAAKDSGFTVVSTGSEGTLDFADHNAVHNALKESQVVLSSVPPADDTDPVLDMYGPALGGKWLAYLSSTGVYGDADGAWVDESASTGGGPPLTSNHS